MFVKSLLGLLLSIALAAATVAACPCGPDCQCGPKCDCPTAGRMDVTIQPIGDKPRIDDATIWSYEEGLELSKKANLPLVTYVGGGRIRAYPAPGRVTCYTPSLAGFPTPCVTVGVWCQDGYCYGRVVDTGKTAKAIDSAIVDKTVNEIKAWHAAPISPFPDCPNGRCPKR